MSLALLGILNSQAAGGGVAGSYDLLETQELASAVSSVTFSGLDAYSDYRHLQLRIVGRSTDGNQMRLNFNSNTTNKYGRQYLQGNGYSVQKSTAAGQTYLQAGYLANQGNQANFYSGSIIDIYDFSASTKATSTTGYSGIAQQPGFNTVVGFFGGAWFNNSAVTLLTLSLSAGNFEPNSRFSLYGVK